MNEQISEMGLEPTPAILEPTLEGQKPEGAEFVQTPEDKGEGDTVIVQ
jgi:hypothetical protein